MTLSKEGIEATRKAYRGCFEKTRFKDKRTVRTKAKKLGIHFYECPRCNGFHLTKVSREEWERREERKRLHESKKE